MIRKFLILISCLGGLVNLPCNEAQGESTASPSYSSNEKKILNKIRQGVVIIHTKAL